MLRHVNYVIVKDFVPTHLANFLANPNDVVVALANPNVVALANPNVVALNLIKFILRVQLLFRQY